MSSGGILVGRKRGSEINKSLTLGSFVLYFEELPGAKILDKYRRQSK